MTNLNERKCTNCGLTYSNTYITTSGYNYTKETSYCSRSCAGKYSKSISKESDILSCLS